MSWCIVYIFTMFNKVTVSLVFPMNFNQFYLYKSKVILWNCVCRFNTLILARTIIPLFHANVPVVTQRLWTMPAWIGWRWRPIVILTAFAWTVTLHSHTVNLNLALMISGLGRRVELQARSTYMSCYLHVLSIVGLTYNGHHDEWPYPSIISL